MSTEKYLYNPDQNPLVRLDYRPSEYKIDTVDLKIDLDAENTHVKSRIVVERNPVVPDLGGPLILDGEELKLISAKILENGTWRPLDRQEYIVDDKQLILKRPPEGRFELEIETEFNPSANTKLDGIYTSGDLICSHCEAQGFRRVTYFLDRPDNLSKYTVTLEADKEKYPILLSNGNGDFRATKDLGNGRHSITWSDPWPKPSYLFATVAGDLKVIEDTFTTMSGKKVDLAIFVQPGYEDKVSWAMESIKNMMKWDEEKYGREYDLDCFHVVAVDKFNAGACENKGLNIFNVAYLVGDYKTATDDELIHIENVIGHEYSHNWTGDRVTLRDWFELSLKESLTNLRAAQFTSDMHSAAIATIDDAVSLRSGQFPEDAGPSSRCIRPDEIETVRSMYSSTTYDKGQHVLGMMNTILGDTLWRKAMDKYFDTFDGQAVTVDDFIDIMQDTSGIDLTQFRRWYSQSGTPEISYEGKYDAAAKTYSLTLKQHTAATADQTESEKQNLFIPISVGLIGENGKDVPLTMAGDTADKTGTTRVLNLTEAEQTFVFKNVNGPVVPSILRGFSAPVKLVTQPSDKELIFRMAHDSDPFNRYEAGSGLMLKTINSLIKDSQEGKPLALKRDFLDAYASNIALANGGDQSFASRMLALPAYGIIEQSMKTVDPDAIKAVTTFIGKKLAETFKDDFARLYQETNAPAGEVHDLSAEQVGRRDMHNLSLSFLAKRETPEAAVAAETQYKQAESMTEKLGALNTLVQMKGAAGATALENFYQTYKDNNNVVDKWLRLQAKVASDDITGHIRDVMKHEAFDMTNPNKVRALIGGFFAGNPTAFHNKDGSGYKLVADVAIELSSLVPRTALLIVKPLTQFKNFDEQRQKLMIKELERIAATPNLDKGVKEVVGQALATAKPKQTKGAAQKFGKVA